MRRSRLCFWQWVSNGGGSGGGWIVAPHSDTAHGVGADGVERPGIFFFRREAKPYFCNYSKNVWSVVEWPYDEWGVMDPTPGVSLVTKKSTHLAVGGDTVGAPTVENGGIGLLSNRSSQTHACDSVGASGFGLEIKDDFNDFVVPPSTIESITALALSSHPYKPFFLVGSTNTCIYLWQFERNRAEATYGPNFLSSCTTASVSAVKFDHFGHRFATAASDGTVCTWQLGVGADICNVGPTDFVSFFDKHALDVTYRGHSGSIVAVSGCSSNSANVIIWDTLAPPTSRTSITCHEGGANSIAVFDNAVENCPSSHLIITGGRDGGLGLHDLRFVPTATNRHVRIGTTKHDSAHHSVNGMLWHIQNAHSGGVTKISTVTNTSLFLTGGRDGDVKLWDATAAKQVFHWPKLHKRRTFFQPPGSRTGGSAVTAIQVLPDGFITCGQDGCMKLVQLA